MTSLRLVASNGLCLPTVITFCAECPTAGAFSAEIHTIYAIDERGRLLAADHCDSHELGQQAIQFRQRHTEQYVAHLGPNYWVLWTSRDSDIVRNISKRHMGIRELTAGFM